MIELFKDRNYDFIGKRKWAYYVSIAFTLIGLTSLVAKGGLRYDIDFTGGTLVQVRFEQAPSVAQIRSSLSTIHLGESVIQRFGDEREYIIRLPLAAASSEEAQKRVQSALAALLTIIGYSVNDTIVAYDRLRENRGKMVPKGRTFADQMNDAVNQTLSRTILTSLTTFFSAAVLLFFGGKTLEDFAFVLFVGVITGTYSTTYVAAAIVVDWTRYVEGRLRRSKKAVAKA